MRSIRNRVILQVVVLTILSVHSVTTSANECTSKELSTLEHVLSYMGIDTSKSSDPRCQKRQLPSLEYSNVDKRYYNNKVKDKTFRNQLRDSLPNTEVLVPVAETEYQNKSEVNPAASPIRDHFQIKKGGVKPPSLTKPTTDSN